MKYYHRFLEKEFESWVQLTNHGNGSPIYINLAFVTTFQGRVTGAGTTIRSTNGDTHFVKESLEDIHFLILSGFKETNHPPKVPFAEPTKPSIVGALAKEVAKSAEE